MKVTNYRVENSQTYLSHIDGLRGIAILAVVLYHFHLFNFTLGYLGVDMFFVISGYLITRNIRSEFLTTGKFDFSNFYVKRLRRLLPALIAVIFFSLFAGFLTLSPSEYVRFTNVAQFAALSLSNLFFIGEGNYFDISAELKPLLHTWSLGIEEQFYLIWPLIITALSFTIKSKNKIGFLLILLALIGIWSIYLFPSYLIESNDLVDNNSKTWLFYFLPFRIYEFAIGALGVFFAIKCSPKLLDYLKLISLILLFLCFTKVNILSEPEINIIVCALVFILLIKDELGLTSKVLSNPILTKLGRISYSLYLVHWPLYSFTKHVYDIEFGFFSKVGLVIVSVALAFLLSIWIEEPIRYRQMIANNYTFITVLTMSIGVIISYRHYVNANDGLKWRVSKTNLNYIDELGDIKEYHRSNYGGQGYPNVSSIHGDSINRQGIDFVLMGDSHAKQLLAGLIGRRLNETSESLFISSFSSLFLPDIRRGNLNFKPQKERFGFAIDTLHRYPEAIPIIAHSWKGQIPLAEVMTEKDSSYINVGDWPYPDQIIITKLSKLHNMLNNRKMIIVGNVPESEAKNSYYNRLLKPKYISNRLLSTFNQDERSFAINEVLKAYAATSDNILFLNPCDFICKDKKCRFFIDNAILQSDHSHLSKRGSDLFIGHFADRIGEFIKG